MSRTWNLIAVLTITFFATSAGYAKAERKSDPTQLQVGSHVELAIKETVEGNRRSSTVYLGKVKTVTGESVTLQDVTKTIRNESSTPVLRSIPYVKRYFRTVGMGQTHLGKRSVVIPLEDIAGTEAVTAVEFRKRSASRAENANRLPERSAP
jgi:hypothetical protein